MGKLRGEGEGGRGYIGGDWLVCVEDLSWGLVWWPGGDAWGKDHDSYHGGLVGLGSNQNVYLFG